MKLLKTLITLYLTSAKAGLTYYLKFWMLFMSLVNRFLIPRSLSEVMENQSRVLAERLVGLDRLFRRNQNLAAELLILRSGIALRR